MPVLFAIALASLLSIHVMAQEATEWEYLVVSYGTSYFTDPLTDLAEGRATRSKVVLFSDLGLTLPSEAVGLQQNMDVLGRFGWELVGVVGSIGGDQQLVFKRLFDAERSVGEADRIREEREALIAEFVSAQRESSASAGEIGHLIDLDAVERAQATDRRNEHDARHIEGIIDSAVESTQGLTLISREARGNAVNPDSRPDVSAEISLDVTTSAMVGPGQYRSSHVLREFERLRFALLANGLRGPGSDVFYCRPGDSELLLRVTAVVEHDGLSSVVRRDWWLGASALCIPGSALNARTADAALETSGLWRSAARYGVTLLRDAASISSLAVPGSVEGIITDSDILPNGDFGLVFELEGLVAGNLVSVAMLDRNRSGAMDTYLYLYDVNAGRIIADDDDSPDTDRSELIFVVEAGTSYAVVASSWGGNDVGPVALNTEVLD